ncbi:MAG TPA: FkbM family methyltransferase [Nitrososphaerales archaeon]|nr:FkbM family methyltransferase [Nitrososphaerales archaeon]
MSWGYVRRAAESAIRNPGALLPLLKGGDPGEVIYDKRMREWLRTRQKYLDEPKQTFGFKIFLNPEDMSQASALIATSGWLNLPVTCLLLGILERGMNVVDVGANLGFYTLLAAKAVGKTGRIWGFEPEPRNFLLMMKSVQASGLHNVVPVQTALSDKPGTGRLYLAPPSEPNAHTLTQDRGLGSLDVPTTTLDDFWQAKGAGRLDLLKVHVFGDEPIVLRGSRRVLHDSRPMVVTRFGSSRWNDNEGLLDDLFSWYDVYEIVESPFLIRPIAKSALTAGVHRGIFLAPKGG